MIEKLEYLIALAREQNFRRAAEVCGIAQPSLSAAIKQLEESLGVMLVRRSSHYQGLTPEGERVLEWARRMVADARALREEIRTLRRGLTGELRLAVIPTALPFAPTLTVPFQAEHPGVRIRILSRSSNEILDMLNGLEADAGITYLGHDVIGRLHATPLYTERYQLLTRPDGPLADRASVAWAEVATLPLCLLTPEMQNRRIIDQLMGARHDSRPCLLESDSVVALIAHVQQGGSVTVVSEHVARTLAGGTTGLRALPITEPDATFQVGLVTTERQPASPVVTALLATAGRVVVRTTPDPP